MKSLMTSQALLGLQALYCFHVTNYHCATIFDVLISFAAVLINGFNEICLKAFNGSFLRNEQFFFIASLANTFLCRHN